MRQGSIDRILVLNEVAIWGQLVNELDDLATVVRLHYAHQTLSRVSYENGHLTSDVIEVAGFAYRDLLDMNAPYFSHMLTQNLVTTDLRAAVTHTLQPGRPVPPNIPTVTVALDGINPLSDFESLQVLGLIALRRGVPPQDQHTVVMSVTYSEYAILNQHCEPGIASPWYQRKMYRLDAVDADNIGIVEELWVAGLGTRAVSVAESLRR